MSEYIFLFFVYLFAGITLLSALLIVFTRNLLYAAFCLLLSLLGISALYVLAGADFVAIAQIVVYVGGVLILLMFGIMLTTRTHKDTMPLSENRNLIWGALLGGGILGLIFKIIAEVNFNELPWIKSSKIIQESTVYQLGLSLSTDYLLGFELIALLLLIALMGASLIAGHRQEGG
jgi:NADH:ubiquinone oxidoreductase subunit 6 (subunit J)